MRRSTRAKYFRVLEKRPGDLERGGGEGGGRLACALHGAAAGVGRRGCSSQPNSLMKYRLHGVATHTARTMHSTRPPVLTWALRARLHGWAPACSVAAAAAAAEDVWRPGLCCPLPPTPFHLCCPSGAAAASGPGILGGLRFPGHAAPPAAPRGVRAVPPSPARGSYVVRPRLRARLRRALPTPPTRRLRARRALDGRRSRPHRPPARPPDVSLPQKSHHRRRVHQRRLVRSCPPLPRAAQALRSSSISAGGIEPGANRREVFKVPLPSRWQCRGY